MTRYFNYEIIFKWKQGAKISAIKQYPDKDYLNSILEYRNGKLFWKKSTSIKSRINIGDEAGRINKGYRSVTINLSSYLSHRLIYIMHFGSIDNLVIDHINGNKLDNRIENLRAVEIIINNQNQARHRNGDIPGISFNKLEQSWKLRISEFINNKYIRISYGSYKTKEEAIEIYNFIKSKKFFSLFLYKAKEIQNGYC